MFWISLRSKTQIESAHTKHFRNLLFYFSYASDFNGVRRKNATRENTNTLKAWLNEHKKNPYPTKGEKIMLAIITKMSLTQVSTWFANARRRLKKEKGWCGNDEDDEGDNSEDRKNDKNENSNLGSDGGQDNDMHSPGEKNGLYVFLIKKRI